MTQSANTPTVRENPLLNFGFNLILPFMILSKGKKWFTGVDPSIILIIALAFPVGYFIYDYNRQRKANYISIMGVISVLMTGGIGLMKLSPDVFAIKETCMPLVFGLFVLGSLKTKRPLIKEFLLNPSLMHIEKIEAGLDTPEKKAGFEKLIVTCTWIFSASFIVSAVINYFVTKMVVVTDPNIDMDAFNAEVGKQFIVTMVVMTIMTMPMGIAAMWKLFSGIKALTGLTVEDIMIDNSKEKEAKAS